jgi:rare lipoprotein A
MRRLVLLIAGLVLLSACGHGKARVRLPAPSNSELEGIASYYAEPYNGRRTASGEIFDTYNAMTAAHKTLPFDTVVRVKNLNNGEEVDVRINDRGPFVKGRVIDLSLLAAKQIDLVGPGVAPVKLKVMKDGSPTTKPARPTAAPVVAAAPPPLPTPPPVGLPAPPVTVPAEPFTSVPISTVPVDGPLYGVQVGAFQSESAANKLRDDLAIRYSDVSIQPLVTDQTLYRVRVGNVSDIQTAEQIAKKLRDEHLSPFVVRLN